MIRKYIMIALSLLMALSLYSCIYEEGDEVAAQAFAMMTAQEKILYDAVEKQWNQKKLLPIRNAVRARKVRPDDNSFPFKDIASVIEKINTVTMVMDSNWSEDTITKKEKAKFNSVDPTWYRKLLGETIKPQKKTRIAKAIPSKKSYSGKPSPPKNPIATRVDNDDLLPLEEYEELRFLMKRCQEAKDIFNIMVTRGSPLTYDDRNEIYEKLLICEARRVNENMRGAE